MQLTRILSLVFFMALFALIGLNMARAQGNPAQQALWKALPGNIGKNFGAPTDGKGDNKDDAAQSAQAQQTLWKALPGNIGKNFAPADDKGDGKDDAAQSSQAQQTLWKALPGNIGKNFGAPTDGKGDNKGDPTPA